MSGLPEEPALRCRPAIASELEHENAMGVIGAIIGLVAKSEAAFH